jgi:hypothetical protein
MDTLVITSTDAVWINPARLADELESALGVRMAIRAEHERGILKQACISRADGLPLTDGQAATTRAVVAMHDPVRPSAAEQTAREQEAKQAAAQVRLAQADLDDLRRQMVEADSVEALREAALKLADLMTDMLATR